MCLITPRRVGVEDGPLPRRRFTREPRSNRSSFTKPLRSSSLSIDSYSDSFRRSRGSRSDYMLDPPPRYESRYEFEPNYAPQSMALIPAAPAPAPLTFPAPPPPPVAPPQQHYIPPQPIAMQHNQGYGHGMHDQSRFQPQPMMSHGNLAGNDPGFIQLDGLGQGMPDHQRFDGGYGNGMHSRRTQPRYIEQGPHGPRARMPHNLRYGNGGSHRNGRGRFENYGEPLYAVDGSDDGYTGGKRVYAGGPRSVNSYDNLNDYGGAGYGGQDRNIYG